ncbi:MAG: hypothetical protein AB1407_00195 [Spirochaetota bacterium]
MKKFGPVFFLFLLCGSSLLAQTTWTISNVTANITNYDTRQANSGKRTVTITRSTASDAVSFYLLVGNAIYGDFLPGNRRVYLNPSNFYDSSSKISIRRTTNASTEIGSINQTGTTALSGSMASGTASMNLTFYVYSSTGEIPDGPYTNIFTFFLYVGSATIGSGSLTPATGGNINVTLTSVGGETFSITFTSPIADFGEINPAGDEALATMRVTAPRRYTISAFSQNASTLLNPNSPLETIPYTFYFNGAVKSLSDGLVQLVYNSNAANNLNYPLRFVTGPIGFLEAGDYTDTVTFSFTSQ